ncbi:hypothetical protein FAES_4041 [Fibrella aestuarina BUZ 2]|uniref:Uncharacterized protein n=1 Tax=Fibrella aestuarina BUZ 2 TaxID=1166018 RepID=I0KD38_9BACT|nr:hypothetical protein [Fibrella aestuarina]CCH02041.1 hypothetical protein FAES_4041 [Fibrella aestuarina BUZ 2]
MNIPSPSPARVLPAWAVNYPAELEQLLMPDGKLVAVPAAELSRFKQEYLSYFCLKNALYQLPTTELIQFLRDEIGDRIAIEVASGNGATGRALGLPLTDSYLQDGTNKTVVAQYAAMGQPLVRYGTDVQKLEALEAVAYYEPQVVVACWATHLDQSISGYGNYWGVDEGLLMKSVETYIHVGNQLTHACKPVLSTHQHRIVAADWLYSRSLAKEDNCIYIIQNKRL